MIKTCPHGTYNVAHLALLPKEIKAMIDFAHVDELEWKKGPGGYYWAALDVERAADYGSGDMGFALQAMLAQLPAKPTRASFIYIPAHRSVTFQRKDVSDIVITAPIIWPDGNMALFGDPPNIMDLAPGDLVGTIAGDLIEVRSGAGQKLLLSMSTPAVTQTTT